MLPSVSMTGISPQSFKGHHQELDGPLPGQVISQPMTDAPKINDPRMSVFKKFPDTSFKPATLRAMDAADGVALVHGIGSMQDTPTYQAREERESGEEETTKTASLRIGFITIISACLSHLGWNYMQHK